MQEQAVILTFKSTLSPNGELRLVANCQTTFTWLAYYGIGTSKCT